LQIHKNYFMKNKKIIISLSVAILLLVTIVLFIFIDHQQNEYNNIFDNVRATMSCAKEGGNIGAAGLPSKCCDGLTEIWGDGGLGICSFCGDNFCDTNYREDKKNCAKDCQDANACINYFQDIEHPEKEVCCKGSKAIKIAMYQQDCSITPNSPRSTLKCMHCGDGRCDQGAYLENKCNCPEDCK
jgi:hypothetical protein